MDPKLASADMRYETQVVLEMAKDAGGPPPVPVADVTPGKDVPAKPNFTAKPNVPAKAIAAATPAPQPSAPKSKPASASLHAQMFHTPEATFATVSLEGLPLITSIARSSLTGWTVTAPVQRGFGSRLIERSARDQLGGEATVDFLPGGVVYTVTCSLEDVS